MIVNFEIEGSGDLSPVMIANNIGNQIGLPFEVVSMGCDDEAVQLTIEVREGMIIEGSVAEPFNGGE